MRPASFSTIQANTRPRPVAPLTCDPQNRLRFRSVPGITDNALDRRSVRPACPYFLFVILIFGNFRLTAATTAACSRFPELLARASRACAASGIGYFLALFSTKSDFGSFFLLADVSLATIYNSPLEWCWRPAARAASRRSNCKGPPGLPCAVTPQGTWPPCIPSTSDDRNL
jgi:hypothetical protein